jgi:hypothetical protein
VGSLTMQRPITESYGLDDVHAMRTNGTAVDAETSLGAAVIGGHGGSADNATAVYSVMRSSASGAPSAAVRGNNYGTGSNGGAGVVGTPAATAVASPPRLDSECWLTAERRGQEYTRP